MPAESPYEELLSAARMTEHEVTVFGSTTRYWEYGQPDATITIVVVHGYRGDHHGLEPVVAHLEGLRFICPDLPGFGESTALIGTEHSIDAYANWLIGFVAALGLNGNAVILGHSFGSIIVAAAVARGLAAPRLVLINPIAAPALSGPKGVMSRLTRLYYRAARAMPERIGVALLGNWLIVQFMSSVMATTKDRGLRRWIHSQHHRYFSRYASRDSVVEGFEASIASDVSMFATAVTMPTLLIGAERDPITSMNALRGLHEKIAGSQLVVLNGVGHLIHYERPREAATAITKFLGVGRVVGGVAA
ncbi:MAG: alpha/beta hydrolase [Salinibacterium sp.]|nr:alpha/beta hydrolase [Salinibacterium sp.]